MRFYFIVKNLAIMSCIGGLAYSGNLMAQQPAQPKPATEATKAATRTLAAQRPGRRKCRSRTDQFDRNGHADRAFA
jgi:hypothetical protein